jgi:hypothetical protein
MTALERNHVVEHGPRDGRPMVFAHGFGCDQNMWRYVWPEFAEEYRIVLFDHVGAGGSDASAFDRDRYASLQGYADDVLEICEELDLWDCVNPFVRPTTTPDRVYFRLHGQPRWRYTYEEMEMFELVSMLPQDRESYVFFNNITMYQDANRFKKIAAEAESAEV